MLKGMGFERVLNLKGGIKAWRGEKAYGPEVKGLDLFSGKKDIHDAFSLAYTMEDNLKWFYERLLTGPSLDQDVKDLLERLSTFEDYHKERILDYFSKRHGAPRSSGADTLEGHVLEGGDEAETILDTIQMSSLDTATILDLAMMFEAQALDYYSRLERRSEGKELRDFFSWLKGEERAHLNLVASMRENLI